MEEAAEAILTRARDEERAEVARWIRALSPANTPWHARPHAGLLFDLEAPTLPDEEYLTACVELGRDRERVARLLAMGRHGEAVTAARAASVMSLRAVADSLVAAGECDAAEGLVRERAETTRDPGLLEWLLGRCRARGDARGVARWSEALLLASPTLDRWRSLLRATDPAALDAMRERVLPLLEGRAHRVAVEIALDEGDVARALTLVEAEPTVDTTGHPVAAGMKLRVAEAAERTHPREALAIWKTHVRDLVATGRRQAYREAAAVARRVCALHDAAGDHEGGAAWVRSLEDSYKRLRALREELAAAGL